MTGQANSTRIEKLRRREEGKWLAGICQGFARDLGWSVWPIRIIFMVGAFLPILPGIFVYALLWILMPKEA